MYRLAPTTVFYLPDARKDRPPITMPFVDDFASEVFIVSLQRLLSYKQTWILVADIRKQGFCKPKTNYDDLVLAKDAGKAPSFINTRVFSTVNYFMSKPTNQGIYKKLASIVRPIDWLTVKNQRTKEPVGLCYTCCTYILRDIYFSVPRGNPIESEI